MADTAVSIALKMQDQASAPMRRAMNQIDRSASTAQRSTTKLSDSISTMYRHLGTLAAMIGVGALARGFTRLADDLTLVKGRLSLVTNSSEELARVQNELFQVANQTRVVYQGTADLYARIARSTKELGISQEDLIQTTKTINQALIVSGASATEASAALIQLSQGLASGALRGDELRSVLEQTPRLARAMAEGLGVGIGQLRELGQAGELTAEKVISSLLSQKDVIEREFSRMPVTVGQAMTILNNEIGRFVSGADDAISLTSKLAEGIRNFANAIHEIDTEIFSYLADSISALWDMMTALPEGFIDFFTRAEDKIEEATEAIDKQRTSYENLVNYMSWLGETIVAVFTFMLKETGNFLGFMLVGIIEFVKGAGKWLKTWHDLAVAAFTFDKEGVISAWGEIWGGILDETIERLSANAKAFEAGAKEYWDEYLKVYGRIPDLVEPIMDKFEKAGEFAGKFAAEVRESGKSVQKTVTETANRIDKVFNAATAELVKLLEESKAAMDQVTLAAMPEYERGIESITRKYAEWDKAIEENAKFAGYSLEEIAQLHKDLGTRMDEEIHDYVKSHETGTDKIYDTWVHAYERLQDITADWIYNMKVDFDSLVDLFKRTVAQMISAWIWGQQNMQFASGGGGGFSLGGIFGGMFGGGRTGTTGQTAASAAMAAGHGPVSEEWALAHGFQNTLRMGQTAYGAYGAYGAYNAAGGGWAGLRAGAGSFFGGGGSSLMPYVAAAIVAYNTISGGLSSAKEARKDPFSTSWERGDISQIVNEAMSRWIYALGGMFTPLGPIGTVLGLFGIDPFGMGKRFNKWFGNRERSYLDREYTYGEYSPKSGWGAPGMYESQERRSGEEFRKSAEDMAANGLAIMNAMDSIFKGILEYVGGEKYLKKFTDKMGELAEEGLKFKFRISAEDKKELEQDWLRSWRDLAEHVLVPIVDAGRSLLKKALKEVVTDSTAWQYFTDEFQKNLTRKMNINIERFNVDWGNILNAGDFEDAIKEMKKGAKKIREIIEYLATVNEVMTSISDMIEMHDLSESTQSALIELERINDQFAELANTLEALGVDPEKYTDLEKAHSLAIADWIDRVFAGAINFAKVGTDWRKLTAQTNTAEQYAAQIEVVRDLIAAYTELVPDWGLYPPVQKAGAMYPGLLPSLEPGGGLGEWPNTQYAGTLADAIELSNAVGKLNELFIRLAFEIQNAIDSIHQSYSTTIEAMRLEVMTGQEQYDYYRQQIESLQTLLPTLADPGAIQQVMDDILRYSQSAWDLLSEEQRMQYVDQYTDFLSDIETEGVTRLENIGNALEEVNKKLIEELKPIMMDAAQKIEDASNMQTDAAETQLEAANIQLEAANTPLMIQLYGDGEVG